MEKCRRHLRSSIVPDFRCCLVEAKYAQARRPQDDTPSRSAAVGCLVLNKNAVDRDAQSCEAPLLHAEDEASRKVSDAVALRHPRSAPASLIV